MASTSPARIWMMRMAFPALALVLIFFHLLPLDTLPRRWAPPDLLLALAMAWSLRRPDFVPVLLLGATMLVADMMTLTGDISAIGRHGISGSKTSVSAVPSPPITITRPSARATVAPKRCSCPRSEIRRHRSVTGLKILVALLPTRST